MRILITGSSGLLGNELCCYLTEKGEQIYTLNHRDYNLSDRSFFFDILSGIDCIIHAAANTNVEACEIDPASCYRDNTLLTERLASVAARSNCKFVYISSTGIYGSSRVFEPYTEYDSVSPTTHHHNSKWLGEQAVKQFSNDFLIIRAGWLFGGNPDNPKNFVARRIEDALSSTNKKIFSNNDQIGVPTYVGDFATKLYELIKNDEVGVFNLVNQGVASRFEYVSKIINSANIDVEILPVAAGSFNRRAKVSNNESAISMKLSQLGYELLPRWDESLSKYVKFELNEWIIGKQ